LPNPVQSIFHWTPQLQIINGVARHFGAFAHGQKVSWLHHLGMLILVVTRADDLHSIAFSSWKKTVSLLSLLLTSAGIPHSIVDGSMSIMERKRELIRFQQDPNTRVLLMTLGTGATG
jgi:SNF2 family DNA or RNA helicase